MTIKDALSHVRWLGGASGAGKSIVARRLSEARDVTLYDTDAVMGAHAKQASRAQCPQLAAFIEMSMDERWVNRTPQTMLETFHWYKGEAFELIIEDLLEMPRDRLILVEGFRLLPSLVLPLLLERRNAVWLLSTADFRRLAFDARGSTMAIARKTSNPAKALSNQLTRDALFADRLREETKRLGLVAITVDGRQTEVELAAQVDGMLFGDREA